MIKVLFKFKSKKFYVKIIYNPLFIIFSIKNKKSECLNFYNKFKSLIT